jgi:hypothetical protein
MAGTTPKIPSCPPYRWYFGRRVIPSNLPAPRPAGYFCRRAFLCALCVLGGESLPRLRPYRRSLKIVDTLFLHD